jgi:Skp family chaperone for outer membrane proteins
VPYFDDYDLRCLLFRYEKLRRRNRLEMEGYQNEISNLQKKLNSLQKIAAEKSKVEEAKAIQREAAKRKEQKNRMPSAIV